jgi:chromosome partitioning protein
MIVSIINEKGGCGKTTISINLARCLTLRLQEHFINKKVLFVDSDLQGSARSWHQNNDGELLTMIALDRPTLAKDVLKFKDDYEWIIIDGVPQISSMSIAAIKCADVVLIPVQPSYHDISASVNTVRFVKDFQEANDDKPKAAFVVSRKIVNTNVGKDIYKELLKYDLPIFSSGTCQRVAYVECIYEGKTVMEYSDILAKREICNLTDELEEFANGLA